MAADTPEVLETEFRAMGSECQLTLVGGNPEILRAARARIDQLEQRWSRFIPNSEVSILNASGGTPMVVSDETIALVAHALEANRLTRGRFDATVLGDMIRSGYDRSFEDISPDSWPSRHLVQGSMSLIGPSVWLQPGTGFDPGGIGKGLAADMVSAETIAAGAAGVGVSLGGDLRVRGAAPDAGGWGVAVEHPWLDEPLATVWLTDGAVATSTSLLRKWEHQGKTRHHLIDPATGEPAESDLVLVTIIASEAWRAEVFAKACLVAGAGHWLDFLVGSGMEGLAVTGDGDVLPSPGLARFADHWPTMVDSRVAVR